MIERTTIRMPSALMDRLRKIADAEDRTVTSLLVEGALKVVDEHKSGNEKRPIRYPRTCSVGEQGSGELPGIDLTRMADIYEMEDMEYVERMRKGFK